MLRARGGGTGGRDGAQRGGQGGRDGGRGRGGRGGRGGGAEVADQAIDDRLQPAAVKLLLEQSAAEDTIRGSHGEARAKCASTSTPRTCSANRGKPWRRRASTRTPTVGRCARRNPRSSPDEGDAAAPSRRMDARRRAWPRAHPGTTAAGELPERSTRREDAANAAARDRRRSGGERQRGGRRWIPPRRASPRRLARRRKFAPVAARRRRAAAAQMAWRALDDLCAALGAVPQEALAAALAASRRRGGVRTSTSERDGIGARRCARRTRVVAVAAKHAPREDATATPVTLSTQVSADGICSKARWAWRAT